MQIGPLHLSLRMDRVDETEGGELLIDYKTGRVSTERLAVGEAGCSATSACTR